MGVRRPGRPSAGSASRRRRRPRRGRLVGRDHGTSASRDARRRLAAPLRRRRARGRAARRVGATRDDRRSALGSVANGLPFSAMRRYHVTTFGCQMNAHDSERIKGMLESLGLGEAVAPDEADVVVFNTCTIREKPDTRLAAYLGNAGAHEARATRCRRRRRRLLRRGAARADLRAVPVRRRRLRPRLDPAPRRLDRRRRLRGRARSLRHARALRGRPPDTRRAARSRPGCRSRWAATRRARTASSRPFAAASRAGDPARSSPRSHALAESGVREITLLGQNVNSWGRDLAPERPDGVRRAPAGVRRASRASSGSASRARIRRTSANPSSRRSPSARASASTFTCPLQSGSSRVLKAMRRTYDRDRYLRLVETPARGRPGSRARNRSHRRVPRRDGGRLRSRRSRSSRRCASTARSRSSSRRERARRPRRCPTRYPTTSSTSASSGSSSVVQRIAAERNAERIGRVEEVLVEGPSRTDPDAAPRAHAAEHDGQLRGHRGGRRARRRPRSRTRPRRRCAGARRRSSRSERDRELAHSRHDS